MNNSHSNKCDIPRASVVWKTVLITICSFFALILSFVNFIRIPSIIDVCVLVIIALAGFYIFSKLVYSAFKETQTNLHLTTGIIVLLIFIGSYMISTFIRFEKEPNDKRRWLNIFGKSYMTYSEQKKLGIMFPESTQFIYYDEGIDWLEQSVQLIAIIDQNDLPEVIKHFVESDNQRRPPSKFLHPHYKVTQKNIFYKYSSNINRAITAKVLVVKLEDNKAKICMDIIYW